MSLLDDPALNLPARAAAPRPPDGWGKVVDVRIRFRASSTFIRKFDLPERATGLVTGTYEQDGCKLAWVRIDTAATRKWRRVVPSTLCLFRAQ